MKIGISLPQGCDREYLGIEPRRAWERTVEVAREAEELGFESLWAYDHMQVDPPPEEAPVFDPFVELSALAMATSRARLGHLVLAAAYRPAGLTGKMITTLDVVSGGRVELGIGAGWKQDEWESYGYGFPPASERLAILADHLEIITRMLQPGPVTYEGRYASMHGALHEPVGLQQPRIPIVIGGNGPNVTWRLASRHADELNLDGMTPEEVTKALPVVRSRCDEIGRDPATLRLSVHAWQEHTRDSGPKRVDLFRRYAGTGIDRIMTLVRASATSDDALEKLAEDALAAGLELA